MNRKPGDSARSGRPRPALWLALGALVLAQWLGLVHAVLHTVPAGTASAQAQTAGHGHPLTVAQGLAGLWSHDGSAPECRLFDPMAAADVPPAGVTPTADFAAADPPAAPSGRTPTCTRHERPPARAPPASA